MPAPKMILNGISINQPPYGYSCEIYTGIKWSFVGDNYRGYDNGSKYFKSNVSGVMLDETMQNNLLIDHSQDITLTLSPDHGFHPFSPIFNAASYSCRIVSHEYTGVLKSPWKYTENKFTLLHRASVPTFTWSELPAEGNVVLWDGVSQSVTGIREIDQPPTLEIPEKYSVNITQTGYPYTVLRALPAMVNSGITSEIEITGSRLMIRQILLFILSLGVNQFYVLMPFVRYDSEPSPATSEPEYWLFGRKIPMSKHRSAGSGFSSWFYGWNVKCISNPIIVTHNNIRNFTIRLKLGLVS
jgi:hypothetical protein